MTDISWAFMAVNALSETTKWENPDENEAKPIFCLKD